MNATFTQVRAQCRRLHALRDLRLIVIDSIQMLDYGTRPLGSRYEEIDEIARGLKLLALELQIPIVAVSTLNRNAEQREDKKPQVKDLRDSGALEDVADTVILIHREDAYDRESPRAGEADLIVAKHSNGPTATITVAFQVHYAASSTWPHRRNRFVGSQISRHSLNSDGISAALMPSS